MDLHGLTSWLSADRSFWKKILIFPESMYDKEQGAESNKAYLEFLDLKLQDPIFFKFFIKYQLLKWWLLLMLNFAQLAQWL